MHIAIKIIPTKIYKADIYRLFLFPFLLSNVEPGIKSPKPTVVKVIKQKYNASNLLLELKKKLISN